MTFPYTQQAYGVAVGTAQVPAYIFQDRDPTENDYNPTMKIYTAWVNTETKGIWYLEKVIPSNGAVTVLWRAVGPIVTSTTNPTTSDYLYPLGQVWVNSSAMSYWGLVNVTGTTATWEELSSGAATGLLTLTGNSGGAVAGDGSRNINLLGSSGVNIVGNPGTNTLTVSLSGGSQAIDSVLVDAASAPGTNPVLPTAAGLITVTGAQIDAGSTPNVIQTNSLAANTYTIQVQVSKTEAASTVGSNGVSHFNSNNFTVDNSGFVALNAPINLFTPTATGQTSAGVTTYSAQSGSYLRTGNLVYAQLSVSWSAATGTGNLIISGFPYKFGGAQPRAPICAVYADSMTWPVGTTYLFGLGADATTQLRIEGVATTTGASVMQMQSPGNVNLSITYETSDPF